MAKHNIIAKRALLFKKTAHKIPVIRFNSVITAIVNKVAAGETTYGDTAVLRTDRGAANLRNHVSLQMSGTGAFHLTCKRLRMYRLCF